VVVVATRHDSHADLAVGALNSGKHVFVEKPLAMSAEDLNRVEEARRAALARGRGGRVMIGFNRRFAPLMVRLKTALNASREPFGLVYVCNAGRVPKGSWIHDPDVGGGRILGEACHFIDVARFLAGSPITESSIHPLSDRTALAESASIQLRFESGSVATVHYLANGTKSVPKERLQVFQGGRIHLLENFRVLRPFGGGAGRTVRTLRQDKGQRACVRAFIESLRDGTPDAVPFDELLEVSRVTLRLAEAVRPPA
jgi:predicted dehydrogenase